MNGKIAKWGGLLALVVTCASALAITSCEDSGDADAGDGGSRFGLDYLARQCGLTCPETGVAQGNASISGYAPIDGFFRSVVNYNTVATGVSADIDAELRRIQVLFGISDAEARAGLAAAINAKLQTRYQASIQVFSTPARCSVDAKIAAQAAVDCQAKANCMVDPGKATFECMGTCTVDANVSGGCDANAQIRCEVSGPQVACNGQCEGSCNGSCTGGTANGAACSGVCMGTCDGTCRITPPSGMCDASAHVTCDLKPEFKAQCNGRCSGAFEPPQASCDASASCEASAKAEAKFQVQCTPPSVEVRLVVGNAALEAEARFLVDELKLRLPTLAAAVSRANYVRDAGNELGADGKAAIQGTLSGIGSGSIDAVATFRIAKCVPSELNAATTSTQAVGAQLKAKIDAANAVATAFGMVM